MLIIIPYLFNTSTALAHEGILGALKGAGGKQTVEKEGVEKMGRTAWRGYGICKMRELEKTVSGPGSQMK